MTALLPEPWASARSDLQRRGLRWTPQRRQVIEILAESSGHVTGAEIVRRCRERDPATIPSTVYRTLDALEELGLVRHGHGADGREEYHVEPEAEHGHRYCEGCGEHWEIEPGSHAATAISGAFAEDGFEVDLSHVTIVGRCPGCASTGPETP